LLGTAIEILRCGTGGGAIGVGADGVTAGSDFTTGAGSLNLRLGAGAAGASADGALAL
jgi:hypothetical protein